MEQFLELGLWAILLIPVAIVVFGVVLAAAIYVFGMILWIAIKIIFVVAVFAILFVLWALLVGMPIW